MVSSILGGLIIDEAPREANKPVHLLINELLSGIFRFRGICGCSSMDAAASESRFGRKRTMDGLIILFSLGGVIVRLDPGTELGDLPIASGPLLLPVLLVSLPP